MTEEKRPYRMSKRARLEQETRARIVESAVHLHGTLGPSLTTVSALAEHAGVRRSTVYRHFPDELALFGACTAHWMASHPRPDLDAWTSIQDGSARLHSGLLQLYAFYRGGEGMISNVLRDETSVPAVRTMLTAFHQYFADAREVLLSARKGGGDDVVKAVVGHALSFHTWRSLALEQGLADAEVARLMTLLVDTAEARLPSA
jgi:AcrR family transcriptional regulator